MNSRHKPEDHALVRDLSIMTKRGRPRTPRIDRRARPANAYQCSCGAVIGGASRREARPDHLDHRAHVCSRAAARP